MSRNAFRRLLCKSARGEPRKGTRTRGGPRKLRIDSLESREMLSVSSMWFSGDSLVVRTDNASTTVYVSQPGSTLRIEDVSANRMWNYSASSVGKVEFQGGNGNDRFINYVSNLPVRAFGGAGNDYLEGYNGADVLVGGDGNDTLLGYGGNDQMWGGNGNDTLRGMSGNDYLVGDGGHDTIDAGSGNDQAWGGDGKDYIKGGSGNDSLQGDNHDDYIDGGSENDTIWGEHGIDTLLGGFGDDQLVGGDGNDHLNGQAGSDKLWGGNGNDTLVAIDNTYGDYVDSGSGADVMWVDSLFLFAKDNVVGASSNDTTQAVTYFANGADRTLNGDNIADPTDTGAKVRYTNTVKAGDTDGNRPLFSSSGPRITDPTQGSLGDCWLIAGMSAVAYDGPGTVQERVVDFNDGTYGVRLGNEFFRVDNQLPVWNASNGATNNNLRFAKLGAQNSLWAAVVEKAFAHYRSGANTYASIEGGWGVEVNRAFGSTSAGSKAINSYSNATALVNDLYNRWNSYQAVTIGFQGTINSGAPLIGNHTYTIYSFSRNALGQIASVQLRNPWGVDGAGSDGRNDGFVTVTPAQLFAQTGRVNWGSV